MIWVSLLQQVGSKGHLFRLWDVSVLCTKWLYLVDDDNIFSFLIRSLYVSHSFREISPVSCVRGELRDSRLAMHMTTVMPMH